MSRFQEFEHLGFGDCAKSHRLDDTVGIDEKAGWHRANIVCPRDILIRIEQERIGDPVVGREQRRVVARLRRC